MTGALCVSVVRLILAVGQTQPFITPKRIVRQTPTTAPSGATF
ncbi:hypothetical protein RISK_005185 [Rhodopirellula islandica]|uniref:Uncharacterized protein n=1 Tax=Rhodopirellula islandica TaxID=595434 RepID=A0A0J1EBG0_RHOIS|nr:hypothetical protein RISK_005185 [Rhodopirellula islandica]